MFPSDPFSLVTDIGLPFFQLAKFGLVFFLIVYSLFAFVLYRQTKILINILGTPLSPAIRGVSLFHLGFSLVMLGLSLVVL